MLFAVPQFGDMIDDPGDGRAQGFAEHRAAGFADGRQLCRGPFLRTVLPELADEQTVRQHDQVHVPCLALAAAKLTIAHSKLLLSVPMEGLRSCPAIPIHLQYPTHFPSHAIRHQYFAQFFVLFFIPNENQSYLVVHFWYVSRASKAPLLLLAAAQRLAVLGGDRRRDFRRLPFFPLPFDLA